jgi:hypothetical protein
MKLLLSMRFRDDLRAGDRSQRRLSESAGAMRKLLQGAIIAAMFFDGNHSKACSYMKDHKFIPHMLEKSRFNRRLHRISMLINDLFHQIGMILKEISDCTEYLLDSFPVAICDNIRIFNVKLIKSEEYRGYIASKKRYFYGVRVQLLTTKSGIPVEFVLMPGSASDVRALNALALNLPPASVVYSDSAYTDYTAEDNLLETSQIALKVMRTHVLQASRRTLESVH